MDKFNSVNIRMKSPVKTSSPVLSKSRAFETIQSIHLSRNERILMVSIAILTMLLLIINLLIQVSIATTNYAVENLKSASLELNSNTDNIVYMIGDQYDYQVIKEVTKEFGLTIDGQRVRSLD